jgi:hypothetical protein
VTSKRGTRTPGRLVVKVTYISVPDAEARLARAIDLLLETEAVNNIKAWNNDDSNRKGLSPQIVVKDIPINDKGKPLDSPKR